MNLTFDTPQWSLAPDTNGPRWYANVSNELEVSFEGRELTIPIAVPTALFTFMDEVLHVSQLDSVKLYLDFQDGFWLFGVEQAGGEAITDLWRYSRDNPPDCIKDLLRRNRIAL